MNEIIDILVKFRDERDWKQFHTPENLTKSIVLEAAELLENFQWGTNLVISLVIRNLEEILVKMYWNKF